MCPWTPAEFGGALARIFAQDYDLLAPSIDVFTPLIYAAKSGRTARWGRDFLAAAPAFVPADRKVQLILDALDFPDSLLETAAASAAELGCATLRRGASLWGCREGGNLCRVLWSGCAHGWNSDVAGNLGAIDVQKKTRGMIGASNYRF